MAHLEWRSTRVGGDKVWYRASAPLTRREGPPIVLVHGLGVATPYLLPVARELADTEQVYAPDLPGFGRSRHTERILDVAGLADALIETLRSIGIDESVLVGNSFGCQIAAEAAARHPDAVSSVVLQGPTMAASARSLRDQLQRFAANAPKEPPTLGPIVARDYARAGGRRAVQTMQSALAHHIEAAVERVRCPVLVIAGSRDPIAPVGWAEELAGHASQGRAEVLPGAHTLVHTAPVALARAIRRFVRGEPPSFPVPGERPRSLADFDSATGFLRACAHSIAGDDLPKLGSESRLAAAAPLVNLLPERPRQEVYRISGWVSGVPPRSLADVDAEALSAWAAAQYPRRRYPAAFVGSSNGAMAHLAAVMEAPWLPQSFLLPVRHARSDLADLPAVLDWGREVAAPMLERNPLLQLHHMHDPNQDFLMARHMSYFRVKLRGLTDAYRAWLRASIEPGGTLYVVDCRQRWPVTRVGERHVFQAGAVGGLDPDDYLHGSERLGIFLRERGIEPSRWRVPASDEIAPEAEWGFEPALSDDLAAIADELGLSVRRLVFDQPQEPSARVADVFRSFYRSRGVDASRVVAGQFLLVDPYWTIRTGSIPFWTVFAVVEAARALERYLDERPELRDVYAMLFPHGVRSVGLAPAARWQQRATLLGVDAARFPADFAALVRAQKALSRQPWPRLGPLARLEPGELDELLAADEGRPGVALERGARP